ncbi:peptidylprolyl isomerase [Candidatus Desantisbacteria bacterium]|nr:peptidylprolyl isomerase [Candidatus Desantisbacteria bacterium]
MINACADDSGGSKKEKVERLHDNSKDAGKDKKTIKEELVILETNQGNIEIRLFRDIAPKACENFVGLVKKGYYNGIIFHRVIPGFMIQGGDPTGTGMGGESIWGGNFEDEVTSSVTFDRPGLVAMANAGPGTNGSQFFITTGKALWLNMKHTIFGQVINKESYDVVQKIEDISTDSNDKPKSPQTIIKAHHEVP